MLRFEDVTDSEDALRVRHGERFEIAARVVKVGDGASADFQHALDVQNAAVEAREHADLSREDALPASHAASSTVL